MSYEEGTISAAALESWVIGERRWSPRSAAVRPALVDGISGRSQTHTLALGADGVLFAGPLPVAEGAAIAFAIDLIPDQRPVGGIGTVKRIGDDGDVAVTIDRIAPHDREILVRYLVYMDLPDQDSAWPRSGREWPRQVAFASVRLIRSGGRMDVTRTVDISAAGLLLAGPEDLTIGETFEMLVELDDGMPSVRAISTAVRTGVGGIRGVRVDRITQRDRIRLIAYRLDHRRRAIAHAAEAAARRSVAPPAFTEHAPEQRAIPTV